MPATPMAEPLFRHAPLPPGLEVFDAHVNALSGGLPPPGGIYRTIDVEAVLDEGVAARPPGDVPEGADEDGRPRFRGGCLTPPAGTDLLEASRRLRERLRGGGERTRGWHPLLRLDAGAGPRPAVGPVSTLRALRQRLHAREGVVGRALLDDPALLDGFAGVKLMPQAGGLPGEEVLAVLARRRTPLLVHAGLLCPPRWLERHLLPKLEGPVVLAHLGSWPCSADDLEHAVALAARDARVYLETSGASIGNFVRYAAERVPEKLLFGSNRPMCPPAVQLAHVAASVHDDDVLRAVAHDNARGVFAPEPAP